MKIGDMRVLGVVDLSWNAPPTNSLPHINARRKTATCPNRLVLVLYLQVKKCLKMKPIERKSETNPKIQRFWSLLRVGR